jgi:hypothetical protein
VHFYIFLWYKANHNNMSVFDDNFAYALVSSSNRTLKITGVNPVKYNGATADWGAFPAVPALYAGSTLACNGYGAAENAFSVVEIADGAFSGRTEFAEGPLTLPSTLVRIGDGAFTGVKISGRLTIPASVAHVGANAFAGTLIDELVVENETTTDVLSGVVGLTRTTEKETAARVATDAILNAMKVPKADPVFTGTTAIPTAAVSVATMTTAAVSVANVATHATTFASIIDTLTVNGAANLDGAASVLGAWNFTSIKPRHNAKALATELFVQSRVQTLDSAKMISVATTLSQIVGTFKQNPDFELQAPLSQTALAQSITGATDGRIGAVSSLSSALSSQVSALQSTNAASAAGILTATSVRVRDLASVSTALQTTVAELQSRDLSMSGELSVGVAARESQSLSLSSTISTAASLLQNADNSLSTGLNTVRGLTTSANSSALSADVSRLQSLDVVRSSALTNAASARDVAAASVALLISETALALEATDTAFGTALAQQTLNRASEVEARSVAVSAPISATQSMNAALVPSITRSATDATTSTVFNLLDIRVGDSLTFVKSGGGGGSAVSVNDDIIIAYSASDYVSGTVSAVSGSNVTFAVTRKATSASETTIYTTGGASGPSVASSSGSHVVPLSAAFVVGSNYVVTSMTGTLFSSVYTDTGYYRMSLLDASDAVVATSLADEYYNESNASVVTHRFNAAFIPQNATNWKQKFALTGGVSTQIVVNFVDNKAYTTVKGYAVPYSSGAVLISNGALQSARVSVIGALSTSTINTLGSLAAVVSTNQANLASNVTARGASIAAINLATSQAMVSVQTAVSAHQDILTSGVAQRGAEVLSLSTVVETSVPALLSTTASLSSALGNQIANRSSQVLTAMTSLVGAAPASLDTLFEIATALDAGPALYSTISATESALAANISARALSGGARALSGGARTLSGPVVPAMPSPPTSTFSSGALITCGSGGTHPNLTAAVAAASPGDRIQILPGTITETALVTVNKSLEIFGTGSTCIVQRNVMGAVIQITAADVYVHDFQVINGQTASADGGGQSCCINADTMSRAAYGGVSGIYIANMTFKMPKVGVFISGTNYVLRDSNFAMNAASATAGSTIRAIFTYGSEGSSFISANTITTTVDNTRTVGIYINTRQDGIAPVYETGYKGDFTVKGNAIVSGGGAPRAYVDATSMFHQSGPQATVPPTGQFSMYLVDNNFALNHQSSPVIIFARGAGVGGPVVPLSFFNYLYVEGNSFGARNASTSQKGAIFFTGSTGASMGAFVGGLFGSNNTIAAMTLLDPNSGIMMDGSLLMVRENLNAPSTLLTLQAIPSGTNNAPTSVEPEAVVVSGAVDSTALASGMVTALTVTAGENEYVINGVSKPVLTLIRGSQYTFTIGAGGHPFYFQTSGLSYNPSLVYSPTGPKVVGIATQYVAVGTGVGSSANGYSNFLSQVSGNVVRYADYRLRFSNGVISDLIITPGDRSNMGTLVNPDISFALTNIPAIGVTAILQGRNSDLPANGWFDVNVNVPTQAITPGTTTIKFSGGGNSGTSFFAATPVMSTATIVFDVPIDAPNTLTYVSQDKPNMGNTVNVSNNVASVSASLSAAASTLQLADASLSSGISVAVSDRTSQAASVSSGVSAFISSNRITQNSVSTGVSTTVLARQSGVASITASLTGVGAALQVTDSTASNSIVAATSVRQSGITSASVMLSDTVLGLQSTNVVLSSGILTAISVRQTDVASVFASLSSVRLAQQSHAGSLSVSFSALSNGIVLDALASITAVDSAINQIMGDNAVAALDTLNELAGAVGSNAALATTLDNVIDGKATASLVASLSGAALLKANQTDVAQLAIVVGTKANDVPTTQLQSAVLSMSGVLTGSLSSEVQSLQTNMTVNTAVYSQLSDTIRQVDTLYQYAGLVNADGSIKYKVNALVNMALQSSSLAFTFDPSSFAVTKVTQVVVMQFDPMQTSVKYRSRGVEYPLNPIPLSGAYRYTFNVESSDATDYANNATAIVITANETATRTAPANSPFTVPKLALSSYTHATPTVVTPYAATTWSDATGKISQVITINFELGVQHLFVGGTVYAVASTTQQVHTLEYLPGANPNGQLDIKALSSATKFESALLSLTNVYNDYLQHAALAEVGGSKSVTVSGSTYTYAATYATTASTVELQTYNAATSTYASSDVAVVGGQASISLNYLVGQIGQPLFQLRAKTGNGKRYSAFTSAANAEAITFSKPTLNPGNNPVYTTLSAGSYRATFTYTVHPLASAVKVTNPSTAGTYIASQAASGGSVTFSVDYTEAQVTNNTVSFVVVALANTYGLQSVASDAFVPIGQYDPPVYVAGSGEVTFNGSMYTYTAQYTSASPDGIKVYAGNGVTHIGSSTGTSSPFTVMANYDANYFGQTAVLLSSKETVNKRESARTTSIVGEDIPTHAAPVISGGITYGTSGANYTAQMNYTVGYRVDALSVLKPDGTALPANASFQQSIVSTVGTSRTISVTVTFATMVSVAVFSAGNTYGKVSAASATQTLLGVHAVPTASGGIAYSTVSAGSYTATMTYGSSDASDVEVRKADNSVILTKSVISGSATFTVPFTDAASPLEIKVVALTNSVGRESLPATQTLLKQFAAPVKASEPVYTTVSANSYTASMTYTVATGVTAVNVLPDSYSRFVLSNSALVIGNLTNVANGPRGTISMWWEFTHATDGFLWSSRSNTVYGEACLMGRSGSNIYITLRNQSVVVGSFATTSNLIATGGSYHLFASWDLSTGSYIICINGVAQPLSGTVTTGQTVSYATSITGSGFGAYMYDPPVPVVNGRVGLAYINYAEFILNVNKFISSSGRMVALGPTGALPTGNAPIVFLNSGNGTNSGSGGNFSQFNTVTSEPTTTVVSNTVNTGTNTASLVVAFADVVSPLDITVVAAANSVGRESAASATQTLLKQFAAPVKASEPVYTTVSAGSYTASMTYTVAPGVTRVSALKASDTTYSVIPSSVMGQTLANFPIQNAMYPRWEMSIAFRSTGKNNQWRALIGDTRNQVNTGSNTGWSTYISDTNTFVYIGSNGTVFWNATTITFAQNTDYVLTLTKTTASLTVEVTNVTANTTQTATNTGIASNSMSPSNGPVTLGGWIDTSSNNFVGTISYVNVVPALASATASSGSATLTVPFTDANSLNVVVVATTNAAGLDSAASATQTLLKQFAAPVRSSEPTESVGSEIKHWNFISLSQTGQYQTAGSTGLYTSSNYGVTWTLVPTANGVSANASLYSGAISSTGQYQAAFSQAEANGSKIYTSSNYGVNWTVRQNCPIAYQNSISVSSTGQYQSANAESQTIFISSDYGVTWTSKESVRNWQGISISSNGQYQTAVVSSGGMYRSSDFGANWTLVPTGNGVPATTNWYSISLSSTGQYQSAVTQGNGSVYISSNFGVNWSVVSAANGVLANTNWINISISSTGQYQTAVASVSGNLGGIYISSNYGVNWVLSEAPTGINWFSIAVSSTGQYQSASMNSSNRLYFSRDYGFTWSQSVYRVGSDEEYKNVTYAVAEGVTAVKVLNGLDVVLFSTVSVANGSATFTAPLTDLNSPLGIKVVALANSVGRESAASATQTLLKQFAAPTLSGSIAYSGTTASMTYTVATGVTAVQVRKASDNTPVSGATSSITSLTATITVPFTDADSPVNIVVIALANAAGRESAASATQTLLKQFAAPTISGSITYSGTTASMTYTVAPGVTRVSALKASDTMYSVIPSSVMGQTLANFPIQNAMYPRWEMSIAFRSTGKHNAWRALIGDKRNQVNTGSNTGWSTYISDTNTFVYIGSDGTVFWNASTITFAQNTDYVLTLTKTTASLTVEVTNVTANTTQTVTNTGIASNSLSPVNGPVTLGGWINNSTENFVGTISYVNVVPALASATASSGSATLTVPFTDADSPLNVVVFAIANAVGRESAASASQTLLKQFAAPVKASEPVYTTVSAGSYTASMTYTVASGVTRVSALKASDTTYSVIPSSVMGQTLANFPTLGVIKTWTFTINSSTGGARLVNISDPSKYPIYIDIRSDRVVLTKNDIAMVPDQHIMSGFHDLPRPTTFTVSFDGQTFIIRYGNGLFAVFRHPVGSVDYIQDMPLRVMASADQMTYTGPVITKFSQWEMRIAFRSTGKHNAWRALIGDMQNAVNPDRGWGVRISAANVIQFSWGNDTLQWDTALTVAQNTDYVLAITDTLPNTSLLRLVLTNVSANSEQTDATFNNFKLMSANGPVTLGGWINNTSENFVGTISYVNVVPALAFTYAYEMSATLTVPFTDADTPLNVKVVALANADGRESAASTSQTLFPTTKAKYVSVGKHYSVTQTINSIAYSVDDGLNWISIANTIFTDYGSGVHHSAKLSRWVAVGQGTNSIAHSTNGVNWTPVTNSTAIFSGSGRGVAYSAELSRWVAVGGGTSNNIAHSTDGITWVGLGTNHFNGGGGLGVFYSAELSRWVAVGHGTNNTSTIAHSTDGVTWNGVATSTSIFSEGGLGVAYGGSMWVAVGQGINSIAYSTDGITWNGVANSTSIFSERGQGVAYSDQLSRWVAVGRGTNTMAYSANGIHWTPVTNSTSIFQTVGHGVSYNSDQSRWVAVGQGINSIAHSNDGITWNGVANSTSIFDVLGIGIATLKPFATPTLSSSISFSYSGGNNTASMTYTVESGVTEVRVLQADLTPLPVGTTVTTNTVSGTTATLVISFVNPVVFVVVAQANSTGDKSAASGTKTLGFGFPSEYTSLMHYTVIPQQNGIAVNGSDKVIISLKDDGYLLVLNYPNGILQNITGGGTIGGLFSQPGAIALDKSKNIVVADTGNKRIQMFTITGTHIRSFGSSGTGNGQFMFPSGVAVNSNNNIIVSDSTNHNVQIFSNTGGFIRKFGSGGSANGQFNFAPSQGSIAIDHSDNIYVVDGGNNRVQVFNKFGTYLSQKLFLGETPQAIAIDVTQKIIIAFSSNVIVIHDNNWNYIDNFGSTGAGDFEFNYIAGIAVDVTGKLHVADRNNGAYKVFGTNPAPPPPPPPPQQAGGGGVGEG